ncbi:MAG TPA: hypothetical protein PKC43_12340 [Phycisphaerales bacterium]|nr:hypothetical protein [Phycisphaerales bacterium]HMP38222.1 hypothetical protein [Phycisphaerales bacterium]
MSRLRFPVVVFARRPLAEGLPMSYRAVETARGDPRRAALAQVVSDAIAPAFAWRPHSKHGARHRAVFALLSDDELGWIIARILDGGSDELGRPHQVRIEAALIGRPAAVDAPSATADGPGPMEREPGAQESVDGAGPAPARIAALLDPAAWPIGPIADGAIEVDLQAPEAAAGDKGRWSAKTDGPRAAARTLARLSAAMERAPVRLLLASPSSCTWNAGPILDPHGDVTSEDRIRGGSTARAMRLGSGDERAGTRAAWTSSLGWITAALATTIAVAAVVWSSSALAERGRRIERQGAEIERLETEIAIAAGERVLLLDLAAEGQASRRRIAAGLEQALATLRRVEAALAGMTAAVAAEGDRSKRPAMTEGLEELEKPGKTGTSGARRGVWELSELTKLEMQLRDLIMEVSAVEPPREIE